MHHDFGGNNPANVYAPYPSGNTPTDWDAFWSAGNNASIKWDNILHPYKPTPFTHMMTRYNKNHTLSSKFYNENIQPYAISPIEFTSYLRAIRGPQGSNNRTVNNHDRAIALCAILSNELIVSAGMGKLSNTNLGSRGAVNLKDDAGNARPLDSLLCSLDSEDSGVILQGTLGNQVDIKTASIADMLVLNEQILNADDSINPPSELFLVAPFENSTLEVNNIQAGSNANQRIIPGKDFFLEAPFRSLGEWATNSDNKQLNIEKFSGKFASVATDSVNYMNDLLLLEQGDMGITPARIYGLSLIHISEPTRPY